MQSISDEDILKRIRLENPWWNGEHQTSEVHRNWKARPYLKLFFPLVKETAVRRAVVLMGPRRVGKTVMIHHAIQRLLNEGVPPRAICYFSVDNPIYNMLRLEQFVSFYATAADFDLKSEVSYIFFDEIQYLKNWETDLKSFVDTFSNVKVVVSGSAAAALRLRSQESGAGRFTDFLLPPLTFYEYLDLLGQSDLVTAPPEIGPQNRSHFFSTDDISLLNQQFLNYLNYGGYPEVIFSKDIQSDPARFIKSDIIDKVLLRDLPSLYGINDIQELNYLFTTLAFNTADEISLEGLSKHSGVAKNTIKRYIEYLEAAFLIRTVHRIDRSAKRFTRATHFKVYLTNPSMRAAVFSPITENDPALPLLAETAIYSQWFHAEGTPLYYARWKGGEVDIVCLDKTNQTAAWAVEVKWSDRYCSDPGELKSLIDFCLENSLSDPLVTSKSLTVDREVKGIQLRFMPASLYCYTVGHNIIRQKGRNPAEIGHVGI
ncbi:MAG TPA: ATP-binding protein [Terracidiphilus sp.]|nr:ATP-binding protein [Terracidiphilus sp.]